MDVFNKVYTIELSIDACKIASNRYSLFEKYNLDVTKFDEDTNEKDETFNGRKEFFDGKLILIQGDSSEKLKDVLNEVNEPICFWLDAHAGSKKSYARGGVDCPLIQELEVIKNHGIKDHFIAVDDSHLFGAKQKKDGEVICDYSDITKEMVEKILKDINKDYKIEYISPYGQLMLISYFNEKLFISSNDWWNK